MAKKTTPDDGRHNRDMSHLKEHQFKPGNTANKNAFNMRSQTRSFKLFCHSLLESEKGREQLEWAMQNLLMNGQTKEWLQLVSFLSDRAYGTPRPETPTEEDDEGNLMKEAAPIINIHQTIQKELEDEDAKYTTQREEV